MFSLGEAIRRARQNNGTANARQKTPNTSIGENLPKPFDPNATPIRLDEMPDNPMVPMPVLYVDKNAFDKAVSQLFDSIKEIRVSNGKGHDFMMKSEQKFNDMKKWMLGRLKDSIENSQKLNLQNEIRRVVEKVVRNSDFVEYIDGKKQERNNVSADAKSMAIYMIPVYIVGLLLFVYVARMMWKSRRA